MRVRMVVGFRRTISFPAPRSPAPPAGPSAANNKSVAYRARSASLPCRFHPLVLQLDVEVDATPCWMSSPARFSAPSATPRHAVVTTTRSSSSSMPRIWWVADLMRWMSRAKRRSARRQHAATSAAGPRLEAAADPEERERKAAFERLDDLGRCIADVESSGEKVFRALVNTRVSLLNILSPVF